MCERQTHGLSVHEITRPKLAADRQIEKSKISAPARHLQADTDRPDLFELERRFLTDKLSFVPGFANGRRAVNVFHGWLP